jgi:hypothetical protein
MQKFRPILFLATHGPEIHSACIELLAKWNYRLTALDGGTAERVDELIALPADNAPERANRFTRYDEF